MIDAPILYRHVQEKILGSIRISDKLLEELIKADIIDGKPITLYPGIKYIKDNDGNIISMEIFEFSYIP